MAELEATRTLSEKGSGNILMGLRGAVPEEVGWVSDDPLESGAILVKEGNQYGTVTGTRRPGHQPVGVAEYQEVLECVIPSQFVMQQLCRGERRRW